MSDDERLRKIEAKTDRLSLESMTKEVNTDCIILGQVEVKGRVPNLKFDEATAS